MTTTLTARSPEDLLAAVPVVLGFRPEASLVMLTFGATHTFHARVDLPPPTDVADAVGELTDSLLEPCRLHAVERVVFVFYTADSTVSTALGTALRRAFVRAGIDVIEVLRVHDQTWRCVPHRASGRESRPVSLDEATHRFAAEAVFEGRVTLGSREALRATLEELPGEPEQVRARQRGLGRPGAGEVTWLSGRIEHWVGHGEEPGPDQVARALWGLTRIDVRDAALFSLSRATAVDHLRVWTHLLRRAPAEQVPSVATLVAFAAWQSGQGALAWCALDRCFAVDPGHGLGRELAECLTRAVPPSSWEEVVDRPMRDIDTA